MKKLTEEEKLSMQTPPSEEELTEEISEEDAEVLGLMTEKIVEEKKEEAKKIQATKDKIMARVARTFSIEVDSDDGEVLVLQAKRLTEKERVTMNRVNANLADPMSISDEEYEALQKQGYELLAIVITDPKMSVEEWEEVDLAFVQKVLEKIAVLQYETNDAKIIDELRNL